MNKLLSSVLIGSLTVLLYGCGGGNDGPAPATSVAAADTTLAATPTTVDAVATVPFTFSAVPSFGTTATTTVTFTNTATTPAFSIASGSSTASGTTTFGSCIFHVTASTFPAGSPLAVGQTLTVDPCNLKVNTKGEAANGVGQQRAIALVLGAAASSGATVTVGVNPGGQLTLNGNIVGTVTLTPVTGG